MRVQFSPLSLGILFTNSAEKRHHLRTEYSQKDFSKSLRIRLQWAIPVVAIRNARTLMLAPSRPKFSTSSIATHSGNNLVFGEYVDCLVGQLAIDGFDFGFHGFLRLFLEKSVSCHDLEFRLSLTKILT